MTVVFSQRVELKCVIAGDGGSEYGYLWGNYGVESNGEYVGEATEMGVGAVWEYLTKINTLNPS